MSWLFDGGGHEGWAASMLPGGRASTGSTAGYVLVGEERVPESQVVGFQARCECGWSGAYWTRAASRGQEDRGERRVFTEDGFDAPAGVEAAMQAEWRRHVRPAEAAADIAAAARRYAAARLALGEAVLRGRGAGVSWSEVGAAAGISRQSAHERWAAAER